MVTESKDLLETIRETAARNLAPLLARRISQVAAVEADDDQADAIADAIADRFVNGDHDFEIQPDGVVKVLLDGEVFVATTADELLGF